MRDRSERPRSAWVGRGSGYSGPALGGEGVVDKALSNPGYLVEVDPSTRIDSTVSTAAYAVYAGLAAVESRIWLSTDLRRDARLVANLRFHYGANCCVKSDQAAVAIMNGSEWDGLERFNAKERYQSERCVRIVVEVDALCGGDDVMVHRDNAPTTPGLSVIGVGGAFWMDVNRNHGGLCGVDFLLTCGNRVVAITNECFVTTSD